MIRFSANFGRNVASIEVSSDIVEVDCCGDC